MIAVITEGEKCKKCYSCVRICPTKAIEVHGGQADIVDERCISCGYCVNVCTQDAKRVRSSTAEVLGYLSDSETPVYAIIAPSFPAAFLDIDPGQLIAAIRRAGFAGVYEVAFGADLVSYRYAELFKTVSALPPGEFFISTPCPAVVSHVEKLHPGLVPFLADCFSPMEATAKALREKVIDGGRIVFIGPCVAKKDEADRSDLVDAVLTFDELSMVLRDRGVSPAECGPEECDPPHANLGRIYPVTGGLLKAADIDADLLMSPVYVVEGKERVSDILTVLEGKVKSGTQVVNRFFDLLFCEGCIAGPSMPNDLTFYERKKFIIEYMKQRPLVTDIEEWKRQHAEFIEIDLSKEFSAAVSDEDLPTEEQIVEILAKTNKFGPEDELNCRACGYESCREKAKAVFQGKAEVEMCLPYLISKLESTILNLTENQQKLVQAEKLASMGQMAAGIAHEINNPLGVVLLYSHLLKEEVDKDSALTQDVEKIITEAERTRKIVRGILNFAREEKLERMPANINELITQSVKGIAYLNERNVIRVESELDPALGVHRVDPHQLRQVFDNILKNAVEVMPDGGVIRVESREGKDDFTVVITDQGPGIPEQMLPKMFSPFVTTKPVGKGTGLGLAVCYGIVKMHGGSIQAGNNPSGGARFEIKIQHERKEAAGG